MALYAAAAMYGLGYGAVSTLMPALVADFYGPAHAGSLVGMCFGLAGPGSGLGPILGGWLFDLTNTYAWAFGLGAVLNALALLLLLAMRPPDRRAG
jgi:OFA family oxalate/formate antiporter-like MFS transporter